ncbi:hypothetical protein AMTR_s00052p00069760 [Amborella trichopoda]|uniref:Helicase ATP-binding domain-containing protein n=1 Tax=Amborella trichopoda TaxID=13333 RepID=U5D7L7_AMBTC|nr:hypothetical protein AMTR_s00052p00069760 [Amborella trichopoda]
MGVPESLFGKIDPRTFGDRAGRRKPSEREEKLKNLKKKKDRKPPLWGWRALIDDVVVPVEFAEDDEEEERDLDDLHEEDYEGENVNDTSIMQMGCLVDDVEDEGLNVQDIDAYWLQRKITKAYTNSYIDPQHCQQLGEKILKILAEGENREVENSLLRASRATAAEWQKNIKKSIRDEARRLKYDGDKERTLEIDGFPVENCWLKGQRKLVDLESLAFQKGKFPTGCYRIPKRGYEEVHVPALKSKPMASGEELIKISVLPEWAQPAFSGMKQLNRVQSRVYETAPENILLCAPTEAGKTNVAMLTILQQIGLHRNADGPFDNNSYKIVYVATMKALVAEVVGNLSKVLQSYGVSVKELTGDQTLSRQQIEDTQIIFTTPEKWDIIIRKSGDLT